MARDDEKPRGGGPAEGAAPRPRRQARRPLREDDAPPTELGEEPPDAAPDPFAPSDTVRTAMPFPPAEEDAPPTVASFEFPSLGDGEAADAFEQTGLGDIAGEADPGASPVPEVSIPDGAPTRAESLDTPASVDFSGLMRPWEEAGEGGRLVGDATGTEPKTKSVPSGGSGTTTIADAAAGSVTDPTVDLPNPAVAAKKAIQDLPGDAVDFYMGGYHVHRRLGQGGMAVVFLARPDGGTDDVVLKRIRPSLVQEERYVKLFMREARIASSLDHDHIVRILDHAEEDGEYFIVMEYLDGIDLRDLADRSWSDGRALPLEPVLRCLIGAARGLDYAHHKLSHLGEPEGLVHRDVSPENVFLTGSGVTKVLDFGIAKGNQHVEKLTRTGEVKGKVPYLAPEQILGQDLDGRCDLFALCVTAYWLLTGSRPFDGTNNFMTIKNIIEDDPQPPTLLNPFIPEDVEAIVLKGLAKDRDRRFSRCAELADALEALLSRLPKGCDDPGPVLARTRVIARPREEPFLAGPVIKPTVDWD